MSWGPNRTPPGDIGRLRDLLPAQLECDSELKGSVTSVSDVSKPESTA